MEISRLSIDSIMIPERLRDVSEAHVLNIANSMSESGQLEPIEVRPHGDFFWLVIGAHRVAAAVHNGWTEIDASVIDGLSDLDYRLREIDENLIRHDLNALDRAVFLAERKAIYEERYPETKNGAQGGRGGAKNENDTVSFSKDAAEKTGLDERTVQRAVAIAAGIPKPLRKRLAGTKFALKQGELLALAKVDPAMQPAVVDLVTREVNPLPTLRAAIAYTDGRAAKPQDDMTAKLKAIWNRASARERRQFVDWLREQGEIE